MSRVGSTAAAWGCKALHMRSCHQHGRCQERPAPIPAAFPGGTTPEATGGRACRCRPLTEAKMEAPPGTLSMAARSCRSWVATKKCSGLLSPARQCDTFCTSRGPPCRSRRTTRMRWLVLRRPTPARKDACLLPCVRHDRGACMREGMQSGSDVSTVCATGSSRCGPEL